MLFDPWYITNIIK